MRTMLLLFFAVLLCHTAVYSQAGAGMDDSSAWHISNQGSAFPAAYQFNYTTQVPSAGNGGCLRVSSTQPANILFWQKVTLKAGKSYTVDGAVKIGNTASFWCELYLSTVAPSETTDYAPNSNGDVVRGFSTWVGCGPYTDGTFLNSSCSGKKIYTAPGADGSDVDVYFALKTGSSASPLPAPLEVLADNLQVILLKDQLLLSTKEGKIDTVNFKVLHVSPSVTVENFRSGLDVAPTASMDIVGLTGGISIPGQDTTLISDTMAVKVTGLNGTTLYPISLRAVSTKDFISAVYIGAVDNAHAKVLVPHNARVVQLSSAIKVAPHATFTIVDSSNTNAAVLSFVSNKMSVIVTAENGDTKTYRVKTLPHAMPVESQSGVTDSVPVICNKILTLSGNTTLTITAKEDPLRGSLLNLVSDNVWLYFPAIKPAVLNSTYLPQIVINGVAAVPDQNIRVEQYLQGSVVISQPAGYKPLEVFSGDGLTGTSMQPSLYTYYRSQELGVMNDTIRSFRLKKGYMATFAKDELGTGYSRVYVADKADIVIDTLPAGLYKQVSFIRVIPWRWVTKKGWTSGLSSAEALNCSWQYDWNNEAVSAPNVEYIPMRHNRYWNSYDNINNKKESTHALGFNEPDRTDQANMSVNDAIAAWPELLKSGLRLGSPAPSDGGLEWLYQFIDKCDALNYRVDFVAMHWYLGGQSPQQFYNRLKAIHDRTGRPIWITEWNNGANWTCCKPTYPQDAEAIAGFLHMLDTTSFVERYSLYEWVEDTRQMFYKSPTLLTPAGEVYRDKISPMAYNAAAAYSHPYAIPPVLPVEYAGAGVGFDYGKSLAVDIDNDGDLDIIYSGTDPYVGGILKNDGNGNFTNTNQAIPGIYIPSINAGDIDGDGDLDIIFSGWDKANGWPAYARILRNDGTGIFTLETPAAVNAPVAGFADLDNNGLIDYFMIGNGNNNRFYFQQANGFSTAVNRMSNGNNMQDPDATWADLDNDKDVDFCVEAWNNSTSRRYTQIWKNNGDGTFAEQSVPFKQKHWGSAQFADIDHDGDLDMLLNGDGDSYSDSGSSEVYRIYINDGRGSFTEGATFQGFRQNCNGKGSAFADWDNDGDYDIILSGWSSAGNKEIVNIYLNDGTGIFTKSAESVPGINKGTIELGDFNNNGRIDLLLNGYSGVAYARTVAFLYKNATANANTSPLPPATLQTVIAGDSILFSWSAGSDAETHVNALTYNMYLKDAGGKYYIFPNADLTTGKRMISGLGNAYQNTGWKLKGLPAGNYTWSVQTIDAGYAGSVFADVATFSVPDTTLQARKAAVLVMPDNAVTVAPNPATEQVTIHLNKEFEQGATVSLLDAKGQLLYTTPVSGLQYVLSLGKIIPGIYFVQISKGEKKVIKKIIKH
ncbi:Por secretion system C-terminal sorting domain-containing protein [Chitinophaga sp. YR573]|uniref:glycosyl hydrolase n=1 Tax=Chitinophaga sp. YR573 TaxID=1881040 RepID=UPI0008B61055|nr:glycosyl hydrolase [Chitinophaga sp. YR573]SEW28247.1 Por secretion system C-terminal sorting domain-containing protein [Chitinophaga sp. YR573]